MSETTAKRTREYRTGRRDFSYRVESWLSRAVWPAGRVAQCITQHSEGRHQAFVPAVSVGLDPSLTRRRASGTRQGPSPELVTVFNAMVKPSGSGPARWVATARVLLTLQVRLTRSGLGGGAES